MRNLFSRFAWQNYDLAGKIRLLVGAQAVLVLLVALILIVVQANIRVETREINDSVVQASLLLTELEAAEVEMLRLEQAVTTGYTLPDYNPIADDYRSEYDAAVSDIRDNLEALEETLVAVAPSDEAADAIRDEILVISNNLTDRRRVFRSALEVSLVLNDPETGGLLAELDTAGNRVGSLTVVQSSDVSSESIAEDLVNQGVLIRRLEDQLIAFGTQSELELIEVAAENLLETYNRLPEDIQVQDLRDAIDAYLEVAQAAFNETENISLLTASLNDEIAEYDTNFENLRSATNAQATALNESLAPAQFLGQSVLLGGLLVALLLSALLTTAFGRSLLQRVEPLITASAALEQGELSARAQTTGNDEFTQLASSFNSMATQLQGLVENLEQRVAERTRDLTITAEIGRAVTANTSEQDLMSEVVELIRERFGFYHAQIFIVDPQGINAELAASTGSAGRELLARQHFLPVGSQSVIGRVTDEGVPVIALDTSENPTHRRNELLPDTRAEMALPMRVGTRVIGALDVQSVSPNAFNEDTVAVFQTMADQLAVALENARLYTSLQQAQTALQAREERSTIDSWRAYRREKEGVTGFAIHGDIVVPIAEEDVTPVMREAIATQQLVHYVNGNDAELAIPIVVRGVVVGAFTFTGEDIVGLTDEELGLVESIMERVTLALDNIRLVEETVRRAEYEQVVNEITAKIVGQTDINYILQTTVQELGRILRAPRTSVQLKREGDA